MTSGLMWVGSRVIDQAKVTDEQFNQFYNTERLPQVIESGRTRLALRYKNVDAAAATPYVSVYPVDDLHTLDLEENLRFAQSNCTSRVFGGADIYDLVQFEVRPYAKVGTWTARRAQGSQQSNGNGNDEEEDHDDNYQDRAATMVCEVVEPGDHEGADAELEDWYAKQRLPMLGLCRHYRRTTSYQRKEGATPRYMALHEFGCAPEDLPAAELAQVDATDWARRVVGGALHWERQVLRLIHAQGDTQQEL